MVSNSPPSHHWVSRPHHHCQLAASSGDISPPWPGPHALGHVGSIASDPPPGKGGSPQTPGRHQGPSPSQRGMHRNRSRSKRLEQPNHRNLQIGRSSEGLGSSEASAPSRVDIECGRVRGERKGRASTLEGWSRKNPDIAVPLRTNPAGRSNCHGLQMPFGRTLAGAYLTSARIHRRMPRWSCWVSPFRLWSNSQGPPSVPTNLSVPHRQVATVHVIQEDSKGQPWSAKIGVVMINFLGQIYAYAHANLALAHSNNDIPELSFSMCIRMELRNYLVGWESWAIWQWK